MFHLLLFLFFGAICVAGAVNLLVQSHPINSALSLIAVMASLAVEYLLLGAEFLNAVQIIVYAGAIMVLFIITIMLLNAGKEEHTRGSRVALLFGIPGVLPFVRRLRRAMARAQRTGLRLFCNGSGCGRSGGWVGNHHRCLSHA
jgi:NADH:ubiquinone oxidoreductase subunit 6 (subunit J)